MRAKISIILIVIAALVGFFFGTGMNEAMGGAILVLLTRTRRNDKFQFADLKQNAVPYIAVMRFGAWLLIFMRKELGQKIIAPRFWQGDDFL